MLVKELLDMLKDANPDAVVVLSSDSEGNSYSELSGYSDEYNFDEENAEIGLKKLTAELKKQGYSKEDLKEGKDAVVLWP